MWIRDVRIADNICIDSTYTCRVRLVGSTYTCTVSDVVEFVVR